MRNLFLGRPLRGERYQSVSETGWTIEVISVRSINYESGQVMPEPEVFFLYESSQKYGEMPLSEFRRSYQLLPEYVERRKEMVQDYYERRSNADKDDYARYL
ncbi:hypothetical protein GMW39_14745 [Pectobacterium parmentieri]|uniref:Uncharacterized protein n=1 Tax=Pectobacterium parmentieri TaxID=1905730 RepID=A0A8B3F6R6_PECPM|nr:hypothetical protein [Pectobacterium parmentieri]QHQ16986.1 hypothetical protein GMW39_14745 [Pectobacterium parmentieri]RKO73948.1 hypothetical protein C5E00_22115 [Pectobacterium parmentieri]